MGMGMNVALIIVAGIAIVYMAFLVVFKSSVESGKLGAISKASVAGLMIGIACFLNLFGLEKAMAAIVIGLMGLNEAGQEQKKGRGIAYAAIILGCVYIAALTLLLAIYGPQMIDHFKMMAK